MEISYVKCEYEAGGFFYRPILPITLIHRHKKLPLGHALVDTGSDFSLFPLNVAHYLEIELDDSKKVTIASAGGGAFVALPSRHKITYAIEKKGFRSIRWEGIAYFTEDEPLNLLGHEQCLEMFDLTFRGPERILQVLPRFRM